MTATAPRTISTLAIILAIGAICGDAASQSSDAQPSPSSPLARGRAVYDDHCAECHGGSGKGDGPASYLLNPRPRDLTAGKFKIRSTETGTLPTDDDLLRSVREGLHGTAMPGWETLLTADDIQQVVQYIKTFSPRFGKEQPGPVVAPATTGSSSGTLPHGRQVYEKLQCGKCHGDDGRGTGAVATHFEDDWQQPLAAADLTQPWTFRGGATARDIYLRFRTGMSGTPMPSFKESATDQEMWDLASYVVSLARKPVWQMTAQEIADFYAKEDLETRENPVGRGRYLVNTLGCALCHSPLDANQRVIPGFRMAGGLRVRLEPFGDYPTGNLTSDMDTGLGNWTDDDIKRVLTRGILRDGTRLLPYPMDWASYSTMGNRDLNAIVAYLRTVPPIRNKVPPPSRPFLPIYLWGKFRMLMLGYDPPMIFYPGNAGQAG